MRTFALLCLFAVGLVMAGCHGHKGYKTSANGLRYKVLIDAGKPKATPGDYITYDVQWRNKKDSLLFDSRISGNPLVSLVARPLFKGDPWEIFTFLGEGDSAVCVVPSEVIYKTYLPKNVHPKDPMYLHLRVHAVTKAAEQDSLRLAQERQRFEIEKKRIEAYMNTHSLQADPLPSGLYVIMKKQGTGPRIQAGNVAVVHYTGRLLDGTVFDSSRQPGREPFEVKVGAGQVIKGWDEGLTYFRKGGEGLLIIPSWLGYGERGAGEEIGPNEPLVFEIECLDVIF